jgi:hypothetical protein
MLGASEPPPIIAMPSQSLKLAAVLLWLRVTA